MPLSALKLKLKANSLLNICQGYIYTLLHVHGHYLFLHNVAKKLILITGNTMYANRKNTLHLLLLDRYVLVLSHLPGNHMYPKKIFSYCTAFESLIFVKLDIFYLK